MAFYLLESFYERKIKVYLWFVSKESFKLAWFCQLLLDLATEIEILQVVHSSPVRVPSPHLLCASEVVVDARGLESQRPLHHQPCVPLPVREIILEETN